MPVGIVYTAEMRFPKCKFSQFDRMFDRSLDVTRTALEMAEEKEQLRIMVEIAQM
jgi:hypothetical protein